MNSNCKRKLCQSDKIVKFILSRDSVELETLSVESIARHLGTNRTRLWRIFKKEKKVTLEEYIFRIKINEAAFMLQNKQELTIKEIAERTGYYCYDYFIRVFKQYFGTSPGVYRDLKCSRDRNLSK
jgi:two-component system response regulator YesN